MRIDGQDTERSTPARHSSATLADQASRARTGELLGELRAGRWSPAAWRRFAASSAWMSAQQALARPRAAAEVTALHLAFYSAFCGLGRHRRAGGTWVAVSWALAVTHLGLLGEWRSLGWPNALTLVRANLPALGPARLLAPAALATDLVDGPIARQRGQVTRFGCYADSLADAAFWTWFAARHEPSEPLRAAAVMAWAAPAAAVTVTSFARGEMAEAPRPALLRPAAALQAVLATRTLRPGGAAARGRSAPRRGPARLPRRPALPG